MWNKWIAFMALVLVFDIPGKCKGVKTEKELKQYFEVMTTQLDSCLPLLEELIKNESHENHKTKLRAIKDQVIELIKKKTTLKNKCDKHNLTVQQCWKEAETLNKEVWATLKNELGKMQH